MFFYKKNQIGNKMKKHFVFVSALLAVLACKKEDQASEKQIPISETVVVEVDSVPGKKGEYTMTEDVFLVIQEEPENHFDEAKERYVTKNLTEAAKEVRKSAAYLQLELNKKEISGKEQLQVAKDSLDQLAVRLEKGEKVKEAELKKAFYSANVALYKSYLGEYDKIHSSYASESDHIGMYFDAAIQKVENAEKWSDHSLGAEYKKTIEEGKALSQRLKTDLKNDKEAAKKEWAAFKEKLKVLDEKLEGSKAY
jgi:hypothetical protein